MWTFNYLITSKLQMVLNKKINLNKKILKRSGAVFHSSSTDELFWKFEKTSSKTFLAELRPAALLNLD